MATKYTSKLHDKRVLVIGGTSGIGFCVAENAVEHGAIVTIASSRQSSVDKALERLRASYPDASNRINGHTIDLRADDIDDRVTKLLDFVTENKKHLIDHVAETSGDSGFVLPLKDIKPEDVISVQRVRFLGSIMLGKHLPDYMHKSHHSSYTLTGGVNSYQPSEGWSTIAAIGSAKDGLTRGFAVDLRPIRVNLVAPGAILTESVTNQLSGDQLEGFCNGWIDRGLTGKMGMPEDVAEAYVYCMKDKFLTGQVVLSDGGVVVGGGKG